MTNPAPEVQQRDAALEASLSRLLTNMTAFAAGVTLVGLVLLLYQNAPDVNLGEFSAAEPRTPLQLSEGLRSLDARAITQAGVVLLVLTPVARVALVLFTFARGRDWLYMGISAFVLAALALGILGISVGH